MSLYGSRVINIEKIWLPIPGEALAKRHAATPAPVYVEPTAPPEKKS